MVGQFEEDVFEVGGFSLAPEDRYRTLGREVPDLFGAGAADLESVWRHHLHLGAFEFEGEAQFIGLGRADANDLSGSDGELIEGGVGDEPATVQDDDAVD